MMPEKMLSREDILSARALPRREVEAFGGTVLVRGLTGEERDFYEGSLVNDRGKGVRMDWRNARARLVAMGCIEEDGSRKFTDSDVPALGNLPALELTRLYDAIRELSGLSDEDMEELEKDFEKARGDGSIIASPSPSDSQ
jgi:hypothetical protein